jgi:hypothetical protein
MTAVVIPVLWDATPGETVILAVVAEHNEPVALPASL